ncbi:hypothetical protein C0966_06770 [Bacillus methanolicus]|uniref:hypothetical protein n=1 Tax=Bacillus methanolicus TaxID=1471 RepID=UPI0023809661|nr:hypothetical protein [Bacillus methanolicus]MDE3839071.1 hypothetical protein [Bacillus methanolicus]
MGFLRDLWQTAKEIAYITKQTADEIKEIATDGFKEIVIKGNSNYKTSYEKRDEVNQIVTCAESSYRNVVNDVMSVYYRVMSLVEDHYRYKSSVLERILKEYVPSVARFTAFMEQKKLDLQNYVFSSGFSNSLDLKLMNNFTSALGFEFLGDFLRQRKRVAEADEMLEEAKKYRAELHLEMEKLRYIKANLTLIEKHIKEERTLIERLTNPIEIVIIRIKNLEGRNVFDQKEIKEAENVVEIFKLFEKILTTRFVNNDGQITNEYNQIYRQLVDYEEKINERNV